MTGEKTVVLGVTGSIAAYRAADIVSGLKKRGVMVHVILSEGGAQFITPLTLETLSRAPVHTNQFSRETPYEVEHISLAKRADVFLVAPASANFIGKAAAGVADDLLSTVYLAMRAPVLIAPAMNEAMLNHPAVRENMRVLAARGARFIAADTGLLACGDVGEGRLAPVEDILNAVMHALAQKNDLAGRKIVVTAGPTREAVDPVRFLSNKSTGKMGFAIAEAAARRGAQVKLIAGCVALPTPPGVEREDVVSSAALCHAVERAFAGCDALVMAAAPADFTIKDVAAQKIKKNGADGLTLTLTPTEDILKRIAKNKTMELVMGFAAETENLEQNAKKKLAEKNLDFIAANNVLSENTGFAADTNAVTLYEKNGGRSESGLMQKRALADWLLDELREEWNRRSGV